MKKMFIAILPLFVLFLATACIPQRTDKVTITLESNMTDAVLTVSPAASVEPGTEVTIETSPLDGFMFVYWLETQDDTVFSIERVHTFTATTSITLRAVYELFDETDVQLIATANIGGDPIDISHAPPYETGDTITLEARDVSGYRFEHWFDLDTGLVVSMQSVYSYTVLINRRLEAVYVDADEAHLYVYANMDDFTQPAGIEGPYALGTDITLSAPDIANTRFKHWFDFGADTVVSTQPTFAYTVTDTAYLIAVYEELQAQTLIYETGFEDASKGGYATDIIISENVQWLLYNALIGSLDNDKKEDSKAVRISTNSTNDGLNDPAGPRGFIEPLEGFEGLTTISFLAAHYGSDPNISLKVMVSTDEGDWVVLADDISLGNTLQRYTYDIDYADPTIIEAGITEGSPVHMRITNTSAVTTANDRRANIDDVKLYATTYNIPPLPPIVSAEDIVFPNNSERLTISFDGTFTSYYSVNDVWTGEGCVAIDDILGEFNCLIYGAVDTSNLGEYHITYYALDIDGNYASTTVTKAVFRDASLLDISYAGTYYEGIEGLYGDDLLEALRAIISAGVTLQRYDDARTILGEADADPTNPDNVLLIYDRDSVDGTWDSETWHREHVWPNSRLGVPRVGGSTRNIGTDLHNLRAINPATNNSRGNKFFDTETTAMGFYPGEDRGDVARIYFYMITKWDYLILRDELPEEDEVTFTVDGAIQGFFSVLVAFHFDDPVDDFERDRNDVIFSYQNNRNPYIDHPHLVELIFFDHPVIQALLEE